MIRIAAKAFEAWLVGETIPEDHFNGTDLLKIDGAWYPQDPNGEPLLASNPYNFEVVTDEPSPADSLWSQDTPSIPPAVPDAQRR